MSLFKRNQQGYSLVELMIAMGIMGMVSVTLTQMTAQQQKTQSVSDSRGVEFAFNQDLSTVLASPSVCKAALSNAINSNSTMFQSNTVSTTAFAPIALAGDYSPAQNSKPAVLGQFYTAIMGSQGNVTVFSKQKVADTKINQNVQGAMKYATYDIGRFTLGDVVQLDNSSSYTYDSSKTNITSPTAALQVYRFYRGSIYYVVSKEGKQIGAPKPISVYFSTDGNGKLFRCGSQLEGDVATKTFCSSLGSTFALGYDSATQTYQCMAPVYAANSTQAKPIISNYIPLSKVLCGFATRGLSSTNQFCGAGG